MKAELPTARRRSVPKVRASRMDPDARVAMILSQARQVFCKSGFQSAVVAEIGREIGVSEATIFKYFPSKLDLLNKVIENWYSQLFGDYSRELQFMKGAHERLRYLIWRHLCTIRDERDMCRLMFTEVRQQAGYSKSVLHRMNLRYTGMLRDVIIDGVTLGEFRQDLPVELIRDMVFGGIEHHAWAYLYGKGKLNADLIADRMAAVICAGIGPTPMPKSVGKERKLDGLIGRLEQQIDRLTSFSKERS